MTTMTLHTDVQPPATRWSMFRLPHGLAPVGKAVIKTDWLSLEIRIKALEGGWDGSLLFVLACLGFALSELSSLPGLCHKLVLAIALPAFVDVWGCAGLFPSPLERLLLRLFRLGDWYKEEGNLHAVLPFLDGIIHH